MVKRITLIDVDNGDETAALRSLLTSMEFAVRLLAVGDGAQVNSTLHDAASDAVVILSARAGRRGLTLNGQDPVAMVEAFRGITFGSDTILISTAEATRESGLIQVMLNAGGQLVAPNGTPDRAIIVPWIGACLLAAPRGLAGAVAMANTLVSASNRFNYG